MIVGTDGLRLHDVQAILDVSSKDELKVGLERMCKKLGFNTFSANLVIDSPSGAKWVMLGNAPTGYESIERDPSAFHRDPVLQHNKRSGVPIAWDRGTYVRAGAEDLFEQQEPFGYSHGISSAMHLPNGMHWVFGLDRDRPLPKDPAELLALTSAVQLCLAHSQEAAMRVLVPEVEPREEFRLTPREKELLAWTMEGKTSGEVASILGITERTANMHAQHVVKKLNCTSKLHAVVKAMRLGLI